jgi:hypothetical protein
MSSLACERWCHGDMGHSLKTWRAAERLGHGLRFVLRNSA